MLTEEYLRVGAPVHIAELDGLVETGHIESIGASSVTVEWLNSVRRFSVFECTDAMRRLSPGRLPRRAGESLADTCRRVARESEYQRTKDRLAELERERNG